MFVVTPPLPELTVTVSYLPEKRAIGSNCCGCAPAFALAAKQLDSSQEAR